MGKITRRGLDKHLESNNKSKILCLNLELAKIVEAVQNSAQLTSSGRIKYRTTKINKNIRESQKISNPAYLRKTVDFFKIDEIGTNMDKKQFDPHSVALDKDDYYEGIVQKQLNYVPDVEKKALPGIGIGVGNGIYGNTSSVGQPSIPVFQNATALTGNNTYNDPKFSNFIAQREREAKMANILKEDF